MMAIMEYSSHRKCFSLHLNAFTWNTFIFLRLTSAYPEADCVCFLWENEENKALSLFYVRIGHVMIFHHCIDSVVKRNW